MLSTEDNTVMFTPIYCLPLEIFSHILSYLRYDPSILCQFALSSKKLRDIVEPFIYQDVSLMVSLRYMATAKSTSWQLDHVLRTLEANKQLGSFVRSADVKEASCGTYSDPCVPLRINRFLSMLPNLRNLRIGRGDGVHSAKFSSAFLDVNPMSFLRTVCIEDRTLSSTDLVKFLSLERIESVTAVNFGDSTPPRLTSNAATVISKKRPVSLQIKQSGILPVTVHGSILRDVLTGSAPAKINNLTCYIPGLYPIGREFTAPRLSPKALEAALAPIRDHVEALQICRGRHGITHSRGRWISHRLSTDGSTLDLSAFPALRNLHVNSACLFSPATLPTHRAGVHSLLPPDLRTLQIVFDEDCGLFWPTKAAWRALGRDALRHLRPHDYRWLVDLLASKPARCPRLERVEIREAPKRAADPFAADAGAPSRGFQWAVPPALRELADRVGVTLDVWLESHGEGWERSASDEEFDDAGGSVEMDDEVDV